MMRVSADPIDRPTLGEWVEKRGLAESWAEALDC